MFASDWLEKRLVVNRDLSPQELQAIRAVRSPNLLESLRQELSQLATLQPLWSRLFQSSPRCRTQYVSDGKVKNGTLGPSVCRAPECWRTAPLPSCYQSESRRLENLPMSSTLGATLQVSPPGQPAAVRGAALAAAAIAHGLPCYRETLLPLDLYVRGTDEYGDPLPPNGGSWSPSAVSKQALWRSPNPVTGLQIQQRSRSAVAATAPDASRQSPCSARSAPNSPRRQNTTNQCGSR